MTKYYSESKKKYIEIESMPDQYVRNAFIKLNQKTEYKKDAYETLWDISEDKDKTIERLREQIKDIYDKNSRRGHNYVFSEIPNDPDGRFLVSKMKDFLNRDTYKLRVRGQHLKDGLNWREHTYGQSIDNSKCLRIYIEEK
tara:strand:+ start:43 stop:465 length:423 start_codon:yes stop_codon:yes gene_type:complete